MAGPDPDDPATGAHMRRFWDERAREDAFFFVDDRLEYGRPDEERFWREGERDLLSLLDAVAVELRETDEVVEIGCGLGRLTRALAARVASVRALDVSSEMLSRARELWPAAPACGVQWLLGDGLSLVGVQDASADLCVSHVVFQHLPRAELTLGYVREMGRVLRPGGVAAFQFSNDAGVHRAARAGLRTRRRGRREGPQGREDPAWLGSAVDLSALRSTAHGAGLEVERLAGEGTQFCVARLRATEG
jgi:SAM-dependent methyltransferase